MKTIKINLYKFSELSEDAQRNAIENLSYINATYGWWLDIYEDAKNIGLNIDSFDLDRNRHAEGFFTELAIDVINNIISNHGESCDTFKTAEKYSELLTSASDDEILDIENDFLNDILEDYSIILQNTSDYIVSDEAIIETIQRNDYDFTENGELY